MSDGSGVTLFEAVGGQVWFDALVDRFYEGVEVDPVLRPLYPEELVEPRRRLALFLGQYWGGPTTYSDERGHPRLRMRHFPFAIGSLEHDAWLSTMTSAVDAMAPPPEIGTALVDYFTMAARHLVNQEPAE